MTKDLSNGLGNVLSYSFLLGGRCVCPPFLRGQAVRLFHTGLHFCFRVTGRGEGGCVFVQGGRLLWRGRGEPRALWWRCYSLVMFVQISGEALI